MDAASSQVVTTSLGSSIRQHQNPTQRGPGACKVSRIWVEVLWLMFNKWQEVHSRRQAAWTHWVAGKDVREVPKSPASCVTWLMKLCTFPTQSSICSGTGLDQLSNCQIASETLQHLHSPAPLTSSATRKRKRDAVHPRSFTATLVQGCMNAVT